MILHAHVPGHRITFTGNPDNAHADCECGHWHHHLAPRAETQAAAQEHLADALADAERTAMATTGRRP